jgi:hypothetical protein
MQAAAAAPLGITAFIASRTTVGAGAPLNFTVTLNSSAVGTFLSLATAAGGGGSSSSLNCSSPGGLLQATNTTSAVFRNCSFPPTTLAGVKTVTVTVTRATGLLTASRIANVSVTAALGIVSVSLNSTTTTLLVGEPVEVRVCAGPNATDDSLGANVTLVPSPRAGAACWPGSQRVDDATRCAPAPFVCSFNSTGAKSLNLTATSSRPLVLRAARALGVTVNGLLSISVAPLNVTLNSSASAVATANVTVTVRNGTRGGVRDAIVALAPANDVVTGCLPAVPAAGNRTNATGSVVFRCQFPRPGVAQFNITTAPAAGQFFFQAQAASTADVVVRRLIPAPTVGTGANTLVPVVVSLGPGFRGVLVNVSGVAGSPVDCSPTPAALNEAGALFLVVFFVW